MNKGYCVINRKLFENKLWLMEKFTKGQAWVDLFANANFADSSFQIRGNTIEIKRGQLGWSEITMSKRWGWSRNRTRRFLKWLEMEQQIKQQKLSKLTTITTIINYDKYQQTEQQNIKNDTTDDTTDGTHIIKNIKNKEKKKEEVNRFSSVKEIPQDIIFEIAVKHGVSIEDVNNTAEEMDFKISEGGKPYKDYVRALNQWVKNNILWNKIEKLSDIELKIMKQNNDPKMKEIKLKIQKEEQDGTDRPIFDFGKIRKS